MLTESLSKKKVGREKLKENAFSSNLIAAVNFDRIWGDLSKKKLPKKELAEAINRRRIKCTFQEVGMHVFWPGISNLFPMPKFEASPAHLHDLRIPL